MSTALHQLTISEITCRNLRSADMFGKNDVYVVFRVGSKKVKTHHIKNAGKHASFGEILTMNLSDSDLEHGIDVGAYDYDVGSCVEIKVTARSCWIVASSSTPSTRRLLDGVAVPLDGASAATSSPRKCTRHTG